MLDINNYTFSLKLLSPQDRFPQQWECTILNNESGLRYTFICHSRGQPSNEEIFKVFSDKNEFKKHFFLEADVIPETSVSPIKDIDVLPKTDIVKDETSKIERETITAKT